MATAKNKITTRYLTVFRCGHLIQEIVDHPTNRHGPLGVVRVDSPETNCCDCMGEHYEDCSHPVSILRRRRK